MADVRLADRLASLTSRPQLPSLQARRREILAEKSRTTDKLISVLASDPAESARCAADMCVCVSAPARGGADLVSTQRAAEHRIDRGRRQDVRAAVVVDPRGPSGAQPERAAAAGQSCARQVSLTLAAHSTAARALAAAGTIVPSAAAGLQDAARSRHRGVGGRRSGGPDARRRGHAVAAARARCVRAARRSGPGALRQASAAASQCARAVGQRARRSPAVRHDSLRCVRFVFKHVLCVSRCRSPHASSLPLAWSNAGQSNPTGTSGRRRARSSTARRCARRRSSRS